MDSLGSFAPDDDDGWTRWTERCDASDVFVVRYAVRGRVRGMRDGTRGNPAWMRGVND